ncbi:sensor histidine kinase [Streptomyces alkaliterrae]|uniref:histidine kinase n=1 Tax=Streptomyces alkaliterrae TaxID=2213162 RepID=A0A5P0YR96_9ACTN|nr:histidine kinase [Streptomyces alkaliterrae]MBB1259558.1 hypothetical protein [Streptomyces alkaliterrae]MQS02836.1 hypothetical protein [Streptomyces alkaliterrae]
MFPLRRLHGRPGGFRRSAAPYLLAAPVVALMIAEGTTTGYPPTAAATAVSGALVLAALLVPPARLSLTAGFAIIASVALSVVTTQLAHRPESTPGMAEIGALLLLISRLVRRQPPLRAAVLAPAAFAAASLVLLRLPEEEWGRVGNYGGPALAFAALLAAALGGYLRLLDLMRERQRVADRQEQRLEYARDLHDFVAHHVTAIVAQTRAVRYATAAGQAPSPAELDEMLAGIERAGSQAMESMRGMVSVLRTPPGPAAVRPAGDLGGLRELVEGFAAGGPPVELALDPRLVHDPPGPEVGTTVQRVVQECLTNIRKHASGVSRVTVDIRPRSDEPELLEVVVTDDGQPSPHDDTGGFGLIGLEERVAAVGGTLRAGPRPGVGWQVAARLPLRH